MPGPRRIDDMQTGLARHMAAVIGNRLFVGQDPGVIGDCLAELMSVFLLNHKIPDDLAHQERLREEILKTWCDAVRELVAAQEATEETIQ